MDEQEQYQQFKRNFMERHPKLFHGKDPQSGFYLPKGWERLLDQLCEDIEVLLKEHPGHRLDVSQIKEKFGGLRFHFSLKRRREKLSDGGLSPLPTPEAKEELFKLIIARISVSARVSLLTCIRCGEPATVMKTHYIVPFCTEHFEQSVATEVKVAKRDTVGLQPKGLR